MKKFWIFCFLLFCNDLWAVTRDGVVYTYPKDKAIAVHPNSNIGFTFSSVIDKSSLSVDNIIVTGSGNRHYFGTLKLAENGRTVIFIPSEPFRLGDVINVRLGEIHLSEGNVSAPLSLSFCIRTSLATVDTSFHSDDPLLERELHKDNIQNSHIVFPESIPPMNVLVDSLPQDGSIFIGYLYGAVLNKHGIVTKSFDDIASTYVDFKPYPDGTFSYYDIPIGAFIITDSNFHPVHTIGVKPPYNGDEHEIRRTAEGTYYILGNDYEHVDMRQIISGGDSNATIINSFVLEYDTAGNLLWEWGALDHFKVTDATFEDLKGRAIDFCHLNSLEFDTDSNLLISSRNMDEITKIDRHTGEIIWRFGGKHNQFQLLGDTMFFAHQHTFRKTDAGTYIMFDNGHFQGMPIRYARGVEYVLDTEKMTAARIWEFHHEPGIVSQAMGSVQRLANKSRLICWGESSIPSKPGQTITITEVDSNNAITFDMALPKNYLCYRAYKDTNYIPQPDQAVQDPIISNTALYLSCNPNPVTNQASITCWQSENSYITLSLFDQLGREVSKIYNGYQSAGSSHLNFDIGNLASGMYYLHCTNNMTQAEIKITIAK